MGNAFENKTKTTINKRALISKKLILLGCDRIFALNLQIINPEI